MPANLGLNDEIAAIKATTASATGWATGVEDVIDDALGASNPFGTSATEDVGTDAGDVPQLGPGGRLANERMPMSPNFPGIAFGAHASYGWEDGRELVTAGHLIRLLRDWLHTTNADIFGDSDSSIGGSTIATAGTDIATTMPIASFRLVICRYKRPGENQVRSASMYYQWADGVDRDIEAGLRWRQDAGNPSTYHFSADVEDYRVVSLQGVNLGFAYATDAELTAAIAAETANRTAAINAAAIPFVLATPAANLNYAGAGIQGISAAHGLGGVPNRITLSFRCLVANNGWAVGDEVYRFDNLPIAAYATAVNVGFRYYGSVTTSLLPGPGGGSEPRPFQTAQQANWSIILRAWR